MSFIRLLLIISLSLSFIKAKAAQSFDELKSQLNSRAAQEIEYSDYSDIDYRTRKEIKRDKKKRTNMSKKFGPLKMGVKVRNIRRSNINLNLDLIEAYDLMHRTNNLQELYTEIQPDEEHTIFGPELRDEIKKTIDTILNFNREPESQEASAI